MTLRWTAYAILSVFNLIASVCSIYAFFSMFPKICLFYFFISVPLTFYVLLAKPNKVLDTNLTNWTKEFADQKLTANPF